MQAEDEKKKWKKGDECGKKHLAHCLGLQSDAACHKRVSGREMWERIKQKYEKESLSTQSKLRKEFHNLKKGRRSWRLT
jgi:hypothetical protein